jgi:hypothetical protein
VEKGIGSTAVALLAAIVTVGGAGGSASAHCDTLDGPVVQDARKALEGKDVTPVLKWVREKDEKAVKAAWARALAARGKKNGEAEERRFFSALVKIHRAGEGAPFTGLKPAGSVEPSIAEADRSLAAGSPDGIVKLVGDAVTEGVRRRYDRVLAASKHKDESVAGGREFVEAYVDYTHYVERLHGDATAEAAHGGGHGEHGKAMHGGEKAPAAEHGHGR